MGELGTTLERVTGDPFNGMTVGDLRVINTFTAGDFVSIDWNEIRQILADAGLLTPDVAAGIDFAASQDISFWQNSIDEVNRILATYPDSTLLVDVFNFDGGAGPTDPNAFDIDLDPLDLPDFPVPTEAGWDLPDFDQFSSPLIEFDEFDNRWEIGIPDGVGEGAEWLFDTAKEEAIGKAVGAFWDTATDFLDNVGQRFGIVELGQQVDRARELYDTMTSFHTRVFDAIDDVWDGRITLQEYESRINDLTGGFLDRLGNQVDQPFRSFVDGVNFGLTYSNSFNLVYGMSEGLTGLETQDALVGGGASDSIMGLGGDDMLAGFGGADSLNGGDGDDLVAGGSDNDTIDGGDGNDRGYGQEGDDLIAGGAGNDSLFGNLGDDIVLGGEGNDSLKAQTGADLLNGSGGGDVAFGGGDNDTIDGGDGSDTLNGNSGFDTVIGGSGNDTLRGQGGRDSLEGGDGDDLLLGMQGFDTLVGGAGRDTLIGGPADDTLVGGLDSDTFTFAAGQGANVIVDFEQGVDLILMQGFTVDSQLQAADTGDGARVTAAVGGDGLSITLNGIAANQLTLSDFVFG